MWHFLRKMGAALFLVGLLAGPTQAQELEDLFKKRDRGPPVGQYTLAALATMLVLTVVCFPSRKN
jgi:hypothetical protein